VEKLVHDRRQRAWSTRSPAKLYYALRSAELCAHALLVERPEQYRAQLKDEILPELKLAASLSQRFYRGQISATVSWSGWWLSPRKAPAFAT